MSKCSFLKYILLDDFSAGTGCITSDSATNDIVPYVSLSEC